MEGRSNKVYCQPISPWIYLAQQFDNNNKHLIHRITDIPKMGVKVPKNSNANAWMQILTGSTTTKNSKGLLINKIPDLCARWTAIIVSLFFTPAGRASDVKMTMVESIDQIFKKEEIFN
jgi:hypothetical protein